eukprot:TRINITY_DN33777_c1_g1_i1.p1 TRINITY_DN33777_c1_g1~~TRINITY_DN33777_c1_g1_i1.p1  ORF type:complete len:288 (-),score=43.82 TRINITY_DN33777_c1_g1_i1:52-915(-)
MELNCHVLRNPDTLSAEPVTVLCYVCYEDVDPNECVDLDCECAGTLCGICWGKWNDPRRAGVQPGGCPMCREGAAPAPMLVHAQLLLERLRQHRSALSNLPQEQLSPWIRACVRGFLKDMKERPAPARMNYADISRLVRVTSSTVHIAVPGHPNFVLQFTRPFTVLFKKQELGSRGRRGGIEADGEREEGETADAGAGAASAMERVAVASRRMFLGTREIRSRGQREGETADAGAVAAAVAGAESAMGQASVASREISMPEESWLPRPFVAFGEIFADIIELMQHGA